MIDLTKGPRRKIVQMATSSDNTVRMSVRNSLLLIATGSRKHMFE